MLIPFPAGHRRAHAATGAHPAREGPALSSRWSARSSPPARPGRRGRRSSRSHHRPRKRSAPRTRSPALPPSPSANAGSRATLEQGSAARRGLFMCGSKKAINTVYTSSYPRPPLREEPPTPGLPASATTCARVAVATGAQERGLTCGLDDRGPPPLVMTRFRPMPATQRHRRPRGAGFHAIAIPDARTALSHSPVRVRSTHFVF